ncbi:MAG: YraN family protein [Chloroflexi bacterium]|nr:MAG: YraN family protein [Chloroflexota bacterium]
MDRRVLGLAGEHVAERELIHRGYEIVARNVRTRYGEIDLICRDRREFLFVEVKTRRAGSFVAAVEAVDPQRRGTIGQACARESYRDRVTSRPSMRTCAPAALRAMRSREPCGIRTSCHPSPRTRTRSSHTASTGECAQPCSGPTPGAQSAEPKLNSIGWFAGS